MKPAAALERLRATPELARLAAALGEAAPDAFLVGGLLRDAVLERAPGASLDVDLAVKSGAKALAARAARALGGTAFLLHEETRVWRVAVPAGKAGRALQIDVGEFQGPDIDADLRRRDFTINALAAPLLLGDDARFLDPCGGLPDAAKKILRLAGPRALSEDPLRVLRAFRLAATLGLRIEPKTLAAARAARGLLSSCSGERVRVELLGILSVPAAPGLELMDKAGVLTAVFPELEPSRRCALAYYGKGGVLRHSLDCVARMDRLLAGLEEIYPRHAERLRAHLAGGLGGAERHAALLRLAVLLHDVSKPECAKRIGGRLRFFGHDAKGAERVEAILRRLRFSGDEIAMSRAAVLHHLRPGNLAAGGRLSDKAIFRFFRDLGPHGVDLLLLCWADHASYLKPAALERLLP
ncbi:MAG TPA: hypothetical protein VNI01_11120, partial [Elusimicrobiota bacterium]|nr:hypothetical protein [Elusimicrobiota bacterium]